LAIKRTKSNTKARNTAELGLVENFVKTLPQKDLIRFYELHQKDIRGLTDAQVIRHIQGIVRYRETENTLAKDTKKTYIRTQVATKKAIENLKSNPIVHISYLAVALHTNSSSILRIIHAAGIKLETFTQAGHHEITVNALETFQALQNRKVRQKSTRGMSPVQKKRSLKNLEAIAERAKEILNE